MAITFARLILEGTVPAGISFPDAGGTRVRYDDIYTNRLPPVTLK